MLRVRVCVSSPNDPSLFVTSFFFFFFLRGSSHSDRIGGKYESRFRMFVFSFLGVAIWSRFRVTVFPSDFSSLSRTHVWFAKEKGTSGPLSRCGWLVPRRPWLSPYIPRKREKEKKRKPRASSLASVLFFTNSSQWDRIHGRRIERRKTNGKNYYYPASPAAAFQGRPMRMTRSRFPIIPATNRVQRRIVSRQKKTKFFFTGFAFAVC